MPTCVYCKKEGKLTREHIVPNFICAFLSKNDRKHSGWNTRANKVLPSEATIKDVCSKCNSEILGELDNYSKHFLELNNFLVHNSITSTTRIDYDYNKLHRWILKVLYNSARSINPNIDLFNQYIEYIIQDASLPSTADNLIVAGLLKPEVIPSEMAEDFRLDGINIAVNNRFTPFFFRILEIKHSDNSYILKGIIAGPLLLMIPLFVDDLKIGFKRTKVKQFVKKNSGLKIIPINKASVILSESPFSWVDTYKWQAAREKGIVKFAN